MDNAAETPKVDISLMELERARLEHEAFIAPVCHLGTQRQLAALYAALAQAQGEFEPISKNRTGTIQYRDKQTNVVIGSYELRYADLEEITAKTRPALSKHGLATMQPVGPAKHGGGLALFTQLIHKDGGMIMSEIGLPFDSKGKITDMGALITYLRRYAKVALLDVSADDDIDQNGEQFVNEERPQPQQERRQDPREPRAGEVRQVSDAQREPDQKEPEYYNQTQFQKSLGGWVAAMEQGKDPDYIIRVAQSKRKLTAEMIGIIRSKAPQQTQQSE